MNVPDNYRGYWSDQQHAHTGEVYVYRTPDGREVHTSMVGNAPPSFPDVEDLGPVAAYVRTLTNEPDLLTLVRRT